MLRERWGDVAVPIGHTLCHPSGTFQLSVASNTGCCGTMTRLPPPPPPPAGPRFISILVAGGMSRVDAIVSDLETVFCFLFFLVSCHCNHRGLGSAFIYHRRGFLTQSKCRLLPPSKSRLVPHQRRGSRRSLIRRGVFSAAHDTAGSGLL